MKSVTIALGAALLLFVGIVRADEPNTAKAHFARGTMLYDLQRYDEAAKEYEAAYELKQDPALLFNIGQAYRFAGNYGKAIGAFKSYLRRVPGASNHDEVEGRIAEMEKLQTEQQKSQEKPPGGTIAPAPIEPKPPTAPETRVPVEAAPAPIPTAVPPGTERDQHAGRTLKITGIAVGAVGIAALGAGIAFAVLAQSAFNEINSPASGYVFNPSTQDSIHTDQALETAFLAIGGAAVVTGVTLLVLGVRASHRASHLAFSPALGPGRAGAVVRFTF